MAARLNIKDSVAVWIEKINAVLDLQNVDGAFVNSDTHWENTTFTLSGGKVRSGTRVLTVPDSELMLPTASELVVGVDLLSTSLTYHPSDSLPATDFIPLYVIQTNNERIVSVDDVRTWAYEDSGAAAVAEHEAKADPHPQYATDTRVDGIEDRVSVNETDINSLESGKVDVGTVGSEAVTTSTGEQTLVEALDQRVPHFNTLQSLKNSTTLTVGTIVGIVGRDNLFDSGGNLYEIVAAGAGTDDGGSYIDLPGSGLQAKGIFPAGINIKQFGAKGDFSTNKTNNRVPVQNCVNYVYSLGGGEIRVPVGTYGFSNETTLGRVIRIPGKNIKFVGQHREASSFKMLSEDENGLAYSDSTTDPDGFISLFSSFDSSTDISGFSVRNMTLDYNAAENKTIEGYGNSAGTEPLEGIYPGTSGTGFARFRAALYAFFGDNISFDDVTTLDWPRVTVHLPGVGAKDVTNASVRGCSFVVTETNPGTQDWDNTGVMVKGSSCKYTDNVFRVTSGGTDYYTARTCIQASGEGAVVSGNISDGWHRLALVGNGGQDAVSLGAVVCGNIVRNAKRGIQFLSRDQSGITSNYALENVSVSNNSIDLDLTGYSLNNGDPSSPTGIAMLEIESLGIKSINITGNIISFEDASGSVGLGGITIQPTGSGTQDIDLINISDNVVDNSPRSGINISFPDSVKSCTVRGNTIRNPGTRSDAANENLSAIAIRAQMNEVVVNGNTVIDTRATHKVNSAVNFIASAGSGNVESIGNRVFVTDGAGVPTVINANSNITPITKIPLGSTASLVTATNGDVTPSVLGWAWGKIDNSSATTITNFDDGVEGQEITLLFANANTTIEDNLNIDTLSNANTTPSGGDVLKFILIDGLWREI